MSIKPFGCDHCARRFGDANAAFQHSKKAHPGRRMNAEVKRAMKDSGHPGFQGQSKRRDDDESFASRALDAQLDHAMGIHNPDYDWLVEPYK